MSDELRAKARDIMPAMTPEVKQALRGANTLVGLLSGLVVDCENNRPADGTIRVSCTILDTALALAEHVRDKTSVVAQQVRAITSFVGDPEAWERANGEREG